MFGEEGLLLGYLGYFVKEVAEVAEVVEGCGDGSFCLVFLVKLFFDV